MVNPPVSSSSESVISSANKKQINQTGKRKSDIKDESSTQLKFSSNAKVPAGVAKKNIHGNGKRKKKKMKLIKRLVYNIIKFFDSVNAEKDKPNKAKSRQNAGLRQNQVNKNISRQHKTVQVSKPESKKLPAVIRLKNKFRKNGLGLMHSYYNAYFIYFMKKSEKKGHEVKEEFKTINEHPAGWTREIYQSEIHEKNIYDSYLSILILISKIFGALCYIPAKIKKFFSSIYNVLVSLENSSKTLENFKKFFKKTFPATMATASIIFTAAMIININSFMPNFQIYINGESVGIVEDIQNLDNSIALVEKNISSVLNISYKLSVNISYKIVLTKNPVYLSKLDLYNSLYKFSQDSITAAYGLYMDGKLIGAAVKQEDIENALQEILYEQNQILKRAENKDEAADSETGQEHFEFLNEVRVVQAKYQNHTVMTAEELKTAMMLTMGSDSHVSFAVDNALTEAQLTNTISRESLTLTPTPAFSSLFASNLGVGSSYYFVFDEFLSDMSISDLALQFKKIKSETTIVEVPFAIEYKESEKHYVNTTIVQTIGVNGKDEVTSRVSYLEDIEISREITEVKNIKNPVNQVVIIGTKELPSTNPTGKLIFPVAYRYITDKFEEGGHRGVDFVASVGKPVVAADGGTVIFAGESQSYGNYIVIRHAKGMNTLYAHMSETVVSFGEKVFQGQEIGKVGSTGNSTGAHVHFEVHINNVPVDPYKHFGKVFN